MAHEHSPPVNGPGGSTSAFPQFTLSLNAGLNASHRARNSLPSSVQNANLNAYLMPTSPPKGRRGSNDGYRPAVKKSTGQVPACLVNASVTYCGNNQIYAFGGFDQYTDEGPLLSLANYLKIDRTNI